jgi:excisionase family DNA binding protein
MKKSSSFHSSDLLSISEVAWLLGVDESRVSRAIRVGTVPVVRRGRRLLIPAYALAHLADSDEGATGSRSAKPIERGDAR